MYVCVTNLFVCRELTRKCLKIELIEKKPVLHVYRGDTPLEKDPELYVVEHAQSKHALQYYTHRDIRRTKSFLS